MIVVLDIEAHWGWSERRKFMATSACQQWPSGVTAEVQNLIYGRISVRGDSTVEYASNEGSSEPLRCKGEVVFSATLRALYDAGYSVKGWKPFHHRLTL